MKIPGVFGPSLCAILLLMLISVESPRAGVPTMSTDEVRVGMTGYGLTVFEGSRIDTFQVEIVAVLKNAGPQQDAIICRMSGGPLERTGILQGMSGSPVYIDGKLLGAVSWGRIFTTEPLGGITPIEDMLHVSRRTLSAPGPERHVSAPPSFFDSGSPESARSHYGGNSVQWRLSANSGRLSHADLPGGGSLVPLVTPIFASGLDSKSMGLLQDMVGRGRFQVVQGGSVGASEMSDVAIEPGAALGVTLMDGDMNIGGIGTVTWVEGDTVLGFGHSMFLGGRVDFPLSKAHIYFPWPMQTISHKVGATGPIVGAIRQDRNSAIAGTLGEVPDMLPVRVKITGPHSQREFNYRVVRDVNLGPRLVIIGLFNTVLAMEKLSGEATVELRTRIGLSGHPDVIQNNVYTDEGGLMDAVMEAWRPVLQLVGNPYEPVHLTQIEYTLTVREAIDAAWITGIRIPRRVVRPGQPIEVETTFNNYLGKRFSRTVNLTVPPGTPEGVYTLRVGDARAARAWAQERAPGSFFPRSLDHVIEILNSEVRNDALTYQLIDDRRGMTVDRHVMPTLPHSIFEVMRHSVPGGRIGLVRGRIIVEEKVDAGRIIFGFREIDVAVYDRARPN